MKKIDKNDVLTIHQAVYGQIATKDDIAQDMDSFKDHTVESYYWHIITTPKAVARKINSSIDQHLLRIHEARVILVSNYLPSAKNIIDLGGANGSIYAMGYPHKFSKITVVDLLPDDRDPMYKNIDMKEVKTPNGQIGIHYGDMSDLSFVKNNTIDLVWSGESIEHIPENIGLKTIREAYRVLKPGGYFCLDTPNGAVTQIHTGGGFIHPEHKIEYSTKHLQSLLLGAGFEITKKLGLREMPNTIKYKHIDYTDFTLGKIIHNDPDECYIQYYECRKPKTSRIISHISKHTLRLKRSVNLRKSNTGKSSIKALRHILK